MSISTLTDTLPGPVFIVGDWTVEVATNRLVKADLSLQIEPRLMKLLAYLAAHPERVISKQTIVSEVWREQFVADEAIAVAVYELRKALGDDARNPSFIKTIRKAGFQFIAPVQTPSLQPPAAPVVEAPVVVTAAAAKPRRVRLAAYLVAAVALCAAAVWWFLIANRSPPWVAVLPFEYMAEDSRQAYFARCITDTLITDLASHTNYQFRPFGSVMRYEGAGEEIRAIGAALDVDLCVTGGIQVLEGRVTVTVQVVDAADERHLWAHRYEKAIREFSAIQNEISRDLTRYFGGVSPDTAGKGDILPADVYYSYLMGRSFLNEDSASGAQKAINQFSLVTRKAPAFAPAYAGLAHAYAFFGQQLALPPDERARLAREAAQRALALDESLAEAHLALAVLFFQHERNFEAAARSFEAALRLHPTSVTALRCHGLFLAARGQLAEARAAMKEALFLDPTSRVLDQDYAFVFYLDGRPAAAASQYAAAERLGGLDADAAAWRYLARQAEAEAGVAGQTPGRGTAKQVPSLDLAGEEHLSPVVRAALAAVRGDDARVFANLQEALTVNDANLVYLGLVPALARLHEDARFQSILSAARVAAPK